MQRGGAGRVSSAARHPAPTSGTYAALLRNPHRLRWQRRAPASRSSLTSGTVQSRGRCGGGSNRGCAGCSASRGGPRGTGAERSQMLNAACCATSCSICSAASKSRSSRALRGEQRDSSNGHFWTATLCNQLRFRAHVHREPYTRVFPLLGLDMFPSQETKPIDDGPS